MIGKPVAINYFRRRAQVFRVRAVKPSIWDNKEIKWYTSIFAFSPWRVKLCTWGEKQIEKKETNVAAASENVRRSYFSWLRAGMMCSWMVKLHLEPGETRLEHMSEHLSNSFTNGIKFRGVFRRLLCFHINHKKVFDKHPPVTYLREKEREDSSLKKKSATGDLSDKLRFY